MTLRNFFFIIPIFFSSALYASTADFNYKHRTHSYNAYSTAVRGDVRTVGMAGATIGLADTFIAALDNPAGLAMTLNNGDDHYTINKIHDDYIQNFDSIMESKSLGVSLSSYPWGFSLGYASPYHEGQKYLVPDQGNVAIDIQLQREEFYFSVARVLFNDKLSLGVNFILGKSTLTLDPVTQPSQYIEHKEYAFGATLGAMYKLPHRFLLGTSYQIPLSYHADTPYTEQSTVITNFVQSVDVPDRWAMGLGFIPNRFFRADTSVHLVGTTKHAALLRDNNVLIGQSYTIQPRIGFAYVFADFAEFKGTAFTGAYYEVTRVKQTANRFHKTLGMELKVWVISLGWGYDAATGYQNYMGSLGVDVFKVLAKLKVIPTAISPPRGGWFPDPVYLSDGGLARPLVANWKDTGQNVDPIKTGLDLPSKIGNAIINTPKMLIHAPKEIMSTLESMSTKDDATKKEAQEDFERAEKIRNNPASTPLPNSRNHLN